MTLQFSIEISKIQIPTPQLLIYKKIYFNKFHCKILQSLVILYIDKIEI